MAVGNALFTYPICTACWNSNFDIHCHNCSIEITINRSPRYQKPEPIIYIENCLSAPDIEDIEAVKRMYYANS